MLRAFHARRRKKFAKRIVIASNESQRRDTVTKKPIYCLCKKEKKENRVALSSSIAISSQMQLPIRWMDKRDYQSRDVSRNLDRLSAFLLVFLIPSRLLVAPAAVKEPLSRKK